MALYDKLFDADTVGQLPSGMTRRYNTTGTLNVVDESAGSPPTGYTHAMEMAGTGSTKNRRAISLDAVDADADRDNAEIAILCRVGSLDDLTTAIGALIRGSGTAGNEDAVVGRLTAAGSSSQERLGVTEYDNGSSAVVGNDTDADFVSDGQDFWITLIPSGTGIDVFAYAANDGGGTPLASFSDTVGKITAGFVGAFFFGSNNELGRVLVWHMQVATGADSLTYAIPSGSTTAGRADDFDSAIGTVGTITDATTLAPTIQLVDDEQADLNAFGDGWLTVYTRSFGLNGKTPGFELDFTNFRDGILTPASPWGMVSRVRDDTDPGTLLPRGWSLFDNNSGTAPHTFSNSSAFASDEIEVAVKPRFTYTDIQRAFAYMGAHSFAQQLPSCDSNHVFNTVTITATQNSAPGATINQNAILLDDTSVSPPGGFDKFNKLLLFCTHSSEDQGDFYTMRQIERYLDGVTARDATFRQYNRLYVVCVNPTGRYGGKERWTQEDGGNEDANRSYDDALSEQVNAVKTLLSSDVPRTDILESGHGSYRLHGNGVTEEFGTIIFNNTAGNNYQTRLAAQSARTYSDLGNASSGMDAFYGGNDLGAQLSFITEMPIAATGYPDPAAMYDGPIDDSLDAIQEMLDNSELTLSALAGIPTLSNALAASIGSTSITPQVDVTF